MSPLRSRRVWLALLVAPTMAGLLRGQPDKDAEAKRIAALVRQLGDKKFAQRQAAGKDLEAIGEKALPAVREVFASPDLEVGTRARHVARSIMRKAGNSKTTGMDLVLVDEGQFVMGSQRNEWGRRPDEAPHKVRITRPFLLGKYEVTQAEYKQVTKADPSYFSATGPGKNQVPAVTDLFPVERVSWFDAIEFCNKLSGLDGYEPYYKMDEVKRAEGAIKGATVTIAGGNGYRLPTEAEWEFACREFTTSPYHYGNEGTGREANIKPGPAMGYGGGPSWPTLGRTNKVGSYIANAHGLFDMHGNAGEWCWDLYDADYPGLTVVTHDPTGPAKGTHRVVRGGSWMVPETSGRSASRFFMLPAEVAYYTGFRVARSP